MAQHKALREDIPLPAPRSAPLLADEADGEDYVPVKKRRLQEAQKLHSRLGHAAPVVQERELEAPRLAPQDERVSLLVRAAEMKRDGREEDAGERRVREEQAILDNVMVRRPSPRLQRTAHRQACRRRRRSCQ